MKGRHELGNHFEGSGQMDDRSGQGEKEHGPHLAPDGGAHLLLAHANLLHDGKALLVLVAFGNLLIVDDEHRGHQEEEAQEKAQEQQTAVDTVYLQLAILLAFAVNRQGPDAGDFSVLPVVRLAVTLRHGFDGFVIGIQNLLVAGPGDIQVELPFHVLRHVSVVELLLVQRLQGVFIGHHQAQPAAGVGAVPFRGGLIQTMEHLEGAVQQGEGVRDFLGGVHRRLTGLQVQFLTCGGLIARLGDDLGEYDLSQGVLPLDESESVPLLDHVHAQHMPGPGLLNREARCLHLGQNSGFIFLLRNAVGIVFHLRKGHVMGIHGRHRIVHPDVHAEAGGEHHQHHGGEDADVGQAHGVLLHPVEHSRYADKVLGLVVVVFLFLQGLEQGNAPGGKQAVGADDHQHHRHEKEHDGVQRGLSGEGNEIPCPNGEDPQKGQELFGLGFLLPHVAPFQQLHRPGQADVKKILGQGQQVDPGKKSSRHPKGRGTYRKAEVNRKVEQLEQQQDQQLGEQNAQEQPAPDGNEAGVYRLPKQDQGDVTLGHTQDVIQADLLLPALHEKAVGVQQEDHREQAHHHGAHIHDALNVGCPGHVGQVRAPGEKGYVVKHGGGEQAREQVRKDELPVAHQVSGGQLGEKELTHGPHLPRPGRLRYLQSGRTWPRWSGPPGRAGGRPPRP